MSQSPGFPPWLRRTVIAVGGASSGLGLLVLVGWHTGSARLVQVQPGLPPMMYNVAFAFVLWGAGLLLLARSRFGAARACGTAAAAIGVLGLAENLFGVNLGLYRVWAGDHLGPGPPLDPGPVPPMPAFCFVLGGSALLLMNWTRAVRQRPPVLSFAGCILSAIGAVALLAHATGMSAAYGWGQFTQMALSAAAGFAALGLGLLAFAWWDARRGRARLPRWLPLPAGLAVLTMSLCLWWAMRAEQIAGLEERMRGEAVRIHGELAARMESRVLTLVRVARNWEHWGPPRRQEGEYDAQIVAELDPVYQAIEWADASFHVRWVAPLEGNEAERHRNLALDPALAETLGAAAQRREVAVSRSFDLARTGKGFAVCVPVFQNGELGGFVLGILRVHELFKSALDQTPPRRHIALFEGDKEILRRVAAGREAKKRLTQVASFDSYGLRWRVEVWPAPELVAEALAHPGAWLPATGLLLALLVAAAIYVAQERLTQLAWRNQTLQAEITARKRAERELALRNRIAEIFLTVRDEEVYGQVVKLILEATDSKHGLFGYIDEDGSLVIPSMTRDAWDKCQVAKKSIVFPRSTWGNGIWCRGMREKKTLYSNVPSRVPEGHIPISRNVCLPILFQGEVIGLLHVANRAGDYAEDERDLLQRLADHIAPILSARLERDREERKRKQAEQRLIERGAELEESNKALEAFTYSVSHDLRAPLRHVDGFSRLLLEEHSGELTEDARHYLARIRDGTRQMGALVDDLLNLARLGRRELSLQAAGLNSLVEEALGELKLESEGRNIEWRVGPLPFLECDPTLMKQVFLNLLSNALKFTRPRPRAVIEVGALAEDGSPIVFVRDNGVGFNMKYADKLFGVFQRLHRSEDFEGNGVGLATVERIIHRHGGRVWAEAELDRGATFYFTLGHAPEQALERKEVKHASAGC